MTHESHADKWKSNLEMHILLQSILSVFFEDAFFSVFRFLLSFFLLYFWDNILEILQQASLKKNDIVFLVSLFLGFSLCTFTKIWFVFETSLVAYDDLGTSNFFHDFSWIFMISILFFWPFRSLVVFFHVSCTLLLFSQFLWLITNDFLWKVGVVGHW